MKMLLYIKKLKEGEGEIKSKGDCCVFGLCKSDKFFFAAKPYFTLWKKLGLSSFFQKIIPKRAPERNSFTFFVLNGICIGENKMGEGGWGQGYSYM
jgi:hypothetical protein